ncbi:hypothetical protein RJ640_004973 [Escallonia rubra]|uniref:Uncharacterized protein n=1 Tax=Escallonia rubra TaxID=112253 RepID=A0AA88U522_9ASTE|nr:hypothetical protein RJ640_004973 [Escallonia rubra]
MHARHRSPGNGYRSSSMGIGGVAASSRISPEGSVRGHVGYNSDYRGYNRGFGRGQPKPFQPPPPPRRGDVFVEAGRMATEYLVSKGLLPPNVLSGKWQNGSLKNQLGDFLGLRPQEGDNLPLPPDGRPSALARLGDAASDAGSSRKRFPDELNSVGSRNYMRGRRRMGSFKGYGSEWNREIARSGSWSEKSRASPDKDGNDDAFSGYQEEQQVGIDVGSAEQKFVPSESAPSSELAPKSDAASNLETASEKYQLPDDAGSKGSSSKIEEYPPPEADLALTEKSDGPELAIVGNEGVKDGSNVDGPENQSVTEDITMQQCPEPDDPASKNGGDLLRHCRFAKVPTKTRSSLTTRGSKVDPVLLSEDETANDSGQAKEPGAPVEGDALLVQSQSVKCIDADIQKAPSEEDAGESNLFALGQEKCMRSRSFPERSFMNMQESSEGPPGFGTCKSMVIERGEKRPAEHSDSSEGTKKPREWAGSLDTHADGYFHLSNSRGKQQTTEEGGCSPGDKLTLVADQKGPADISMFPTGDVEPCIEFAEEKQLFPGSFKICDLNLMEASDINDSHDANPVLMFPSIPQSKIESAPVDIDLSMSSNCNAPDRYGRHEANGKDVEVIDLESDVVQEDKTLDNSERKEGMVFPGLESFPTHAENANDIPDGQDGYGLMISELLGADIPNCSSVPPDVNSMHNEMVIHNGEGILGDDDSIYMSLGEIPISMPDI